MCRWDFFLFLFSKLKQREQKREKRGDWLTQNFLMTDCSLDHFLWICFAWRELFSHENENYEKKKHIFSQRWSFLSIAVAVKCVSRSVKFIAFSQDDFCLYLHSRPSQAAEINIGVENLLQIPTGVNDTSIEKLCQTWFFTFNRQIWDFSEKKWMNRRDNKVVHRLRWSSFSSFIYSLYSRTINSFATIRLRYFGVDCDKITTKSMLMPAQARRNVRNNV